MKKDSFANGAFIATFCIFFSKFIGLIYVIPFYAIIGENGGALYGYAYNIYQIFLAISSAGIPLAISKMVSEYETLGFLEAKERTYHLAIKIVFIISIISFFFLMIFAPNIAHLIIGNATGGNSIADIALVIRTISLAILIIPFLSVTKGYLQGHKYISVTSYSEVIEQAIRIFIILFGSYMTLKILNLGSTNAIAVAVMGAFFGGLGATLYLRKIMHKHKKELLPKTEIKDKVTNKEITNKIIKYAVPFIVVSVAFSIYNFTDTVIILRTLTGSLHYTGEVAETIISSYTTWSGKFQVIVTSVATGIAISLIPNIVSYYVKKDYTALNRTFNRAIQLLIYVGLPLTVLLSIFSEEIWYLFYGKSLYGPAILSFSIFVALLSSLNTTITAAIQGVNKFKWVYITVITGVLINAGLNYPLMILFDKIGIYPYFGAITSSLIGFSTANFIALKLLKKEFNLNYKETYQMISKIILSTLIMVAVALSIKILLPFEGTSKLICMCLLILYFIISLLTYLFICKKLKINKELLENINILKKLSFFR